MQYMDWAFSEDGDLILGAPKLNEKGEILYIHENGTVDTEIGIDGKEIRDLSYVRGRETQKQIILNRLKTESPDWYHHPQMGGNLTDLVGEPQTRITGERGVQLILNALTYRNLYSASQLEVRAIPISQGELVFLITVHTSDNEAMRLPILFNLEHGLMGEYVPNTNEGV